MTGKLTSLLLFSIVSLSACKASQTQPAAKAPPSSKSGKDAVDAGNVSQSPSTTAKKSPSSSVGSPTPSSGGGSPSASSEGCSSYSYEKLNANTLPKELEETSGLVFSGTDSDTLVHVRDSGNDPLLVYTKRDGSLIGSYKFSDYVTDTEDLAQGECPWGGSCIYVFDTGDNARSRKKRAIIAVEESSLKTGKPKTQKVEFTYPSSEILDVEAAVLVNNQFYLFEKESKHGRVFSLDWAIFNGSNATEAKLVTDLPYSKLTGAAASKDGKRIVLIGYTGAFELSTVTGAGFTKSSETWFPYRKSISLKNLQQQEAIRYDSDDRSLLYSSEKGDDKSKEWAIMRAACN